MNENDAGHAADVGQVSNLSSEGQVENLPQEIPAPPVNAGQVDQVSGQVGNLPHESGQVENLSYVDRIANHPDLSPAMRQRLAELVQRQPPEEGPAKIALDDVLAILAETVPSALRLNAGELPLAQHPEGEAFFTGDPASDAERQAAAVASEQLALSGLLRR
ncbi:MAG TPA: hypothetical protein VMP01_30165 [Pirellulaceae bacterium]|nr:hypothetical protein [Pirellulaceae bacterium]